MQMPNESAGKDELPSSLTRLSEKNTLEFGYRHASVDGDFIPGGETLNDGSVRFDCWIRNDLSLSAKVQYVTMEGAAFGSDAPNQLDFISRDRLLAAVVEQINVFENYKNRNQREKRILDRSSW